MSEENFGHPFYDYDDESEDNAVPDMFECIGNMLDVAQNDGLALEVLYAFARELQAGADIPTACAAALDEWDL